MILTGASKLLFERCNCASQLCGFSIVRNFTLKKKSGKQKKKDKCKTDVGPCMRKTKDGECPEDICTVPEGTPQPCVVIIGAGVAGLSAASRLAQCGITNFRVLESTDRPGGRIRSCWLGDSVIELGAEHITGASIANKMFTIAAQEQLLRYPLERVTEEGGPFLTSDGRTLSVSMAENVSSRFEGLVGKAIEEEGERSLGEFLEEGVAKELKNIPEAERYDAARAFYGLATGLRVKMGEDLCQVSVKGLACYDRLPGGNVGVSAGLAGVLSPMLRNLPDCSVLYCKRVNTIRWGTTGGGECPRALVVCDSGEEFPADYVIVTVSLGVLKETADCIFCPALPASKTEAIEAMGFGTVNRVFVHFQRPFWSEGKGGVRLAWSPDEANMKDSWVKGIGGFRGLKGSNKVLLATVGGPEAREMEHLSDEEVADGLASILRRFTGDPSLPAPCGVTRSSWGTDQNFYGSFTYMGLNSNKGHLEDLAAPLPGACGEDRPPPIILFAGEHTSPRYFSTLHGARESGIREADRIIQMTKKFKGPPEGRKSCK